MHLLLERLPSPISPLLVVTDREGILRALDFADCEARMHRWLRQHYGDYTLREGATPTSLARALEAYFAGRIDGLADVKVATGGTPFQRKVWHALRAIPPGRTVSYGQLAASLATPEPVARQAPPMRQIRSPSSCHVIALSERTVRSPAMQVALLASAGCLIMKAGSPRSQRVHQFLNVCFEMLEPSSRRSRFKTTRDLSIRKEPNNMDGRNQRLEG